MVLTFSLFTELVLEFKNTYINVLLNRTDSIEGFKDIEQQLVFHINEAASEINMAVSNRVEA